MYINGSLFSSLTEPSSRSLSSSESCSRPIIIPVPDPLLSLFPQLDRLLVFPALSSPEQDTASHRCRHTGPRADLRQHPPLATQQRALQGHRALGEGGFQRENSRRIPEIAPGRAPAMPARVTHSAARRRRRFPRPPALGRSRACALGESPPPPPLMAAPQGLPPRPRPAGSAPKLGVCSSVSLSEKCSGSRTRCKFSLPVNLVKFPGGKGVVNSQQGCGQCGCVKLGRVG